MGPSLLKSDNLAYFPFSIFMRGFGTLVPTNEFDKANCKIKIKRIRLVFFIENYFFIFYLVIKFMRITTYRTTANFPINGSLSFPTDWTW